MFTRFRLVKRARKTSLLLLPLLLMSLLSLITPVASAGPKPPHEPNDGVTPETVGDWCRLTAFAPYTEFNGTGNLAKGKSNFSCSGNTAIEYYDTQLRRDMRADGSGMIVGSKTYNNFTASGGTTYYAIPFGTCISTRHQVYTRLIYTDPTTNTRKDIYTTGPIVTLSC